MPLCDTLLRCAEGTPLFLPLWSSETILELSRTLKKFGRSESQIERRLRFMEVTFPKACLQVSTRDLNVVPDIPDPGDRHVIAAAIKGRADVIVTFNLRHFPPSMLASRGIVARSPDTFLVDLFRANPLRMLEILDQQGEDIRQTRSAVIDGLRPVLPEFVALVGKGR
jgi:hypothetical protein